MATTSLIHARRLRRAVLAGTLLVCAFPAAALADRAPALPASASSSIVPETCPSEAEGAVCGHVDVSFDRGDPGAGTIPIVFELYPHSGPGPAESAIMVNFGGPGVSTTALRDVAFYWFERVRDTHDLLLIDDRGRGRSGAIDCPAYQHATGPLLDIVGECAQQLGDSADRYATAEIAHDNDAVRAALGYERVDFVGTSAGGTDAGAYATRFGHRLRSLILNGRWGEPAIEPFERATIGVRTIIERIGKICARSRACGRSGGEAVAATAGLARDVRRSPVSGTGLDADGGTHEVSIDPSFLLVHILDTGGLFLTPGEIPAATEALRRGDTAPLLRLAAEGDFQIPGDVGDPSFDSAGAFSATFCVDQPWPWSPNASLTQRQAQWNMAVRRADDTPFAPFTAQEIMTTIYGMSPFCLPWPATGTRPPEGPGAHYPKVPTLILDGEFDTHEQRQRQTVARYPHAKLVVFKGTGHTPLAWSDCALDIATDFLRSGVPGDESCASESLFDYPGIAAFPRRTAESPAAAPTRGNRAGRRSLRVARIAADAALDVQKRSIMNIFNGSDGSGPGLRGGDFESTAGEAWTTTLTEVRWTRDVAVSGTLRWTFDGGALSADLDVDGPGRRDGTLHLHGGWLIPGAARSIAITGTLGGKHVAATMPAT